MEKNVPNHQPDIYIYILDISMWYKYPLVSYELIWLVVSTYPSEK